LRVLDFKLTMPIYAYKCEACGNAQDVLQKMSDPLLTVCPTCGQATYKKQLTAAGFQLKGSGWYVTDFREGAKPEKSADDGKVDKKPEVDKSDKNEGTKPAPATADASIKSTSPAPATESASAKTAEKSAPAPAPVSSGTAASTPSVASK
jgi:putative FmdB family regulatory protein